MYQLKPFVSILLYVDTKIIDFNLVLITTKCIKSYLSLQLFKIQFNSFNFSAHLIIAQVGKAAAILKSQPHAVKINSTSSWKMRNWQRINKNTTRH